MDLPGHDAWKEGGDRQVELQYLICPNCNISWPVGVYREHGDWGLIDEKDGFCPECETAGVSQ